MTEKIANKLGNHLAEKSIIAIEDKPVVQYGLFLILADIQQIIILFVTGLMLNNLYELLSFALFFVTLKKYVGGAHAKTHRRCIIFFTLLAHGCTAICRELPNAAVVLTICMMLTAVTITINQAPKCHPHNPKPVKTQKKLRRTAITVAMLQLILCGVGLAVLNYEHHIYFLCASCGSFLAAASLLIPIERRCHLESDYE